MEPNFNEWLGPVMGADSIGKNFQRDPRGALIERLIYEMMSNPDSTLPRDRMQVAPIHPGYLDYPMPEGGFEDQDMMAADPNFSAQLQKNDYLGDQRTRMSPEDIQAFIARQLGGI